MEKKYLLDNIKIEGIEPTKEWCEIAKRQRDGDLLKSDDLKKILNPGYKMKETKNE